MMLCNLSSTSNEQYSWVGIVALRRMVSDFELCWCKTDSMMKDKKRLSPQSHHYEMCKFSEDKTKFPFK